MFKTGLFSPTSGCNGGATRCDTPTRERYTLYLPARDRAPTMPPPPIPARKEDAQPAGPPPIPARKEVEEEISEPEKTISAPTTATKRRPAGAVATVMASGQQTWLPSVGQGGEGEGSGEQGEMGQEEEVHHGTNPYDLKAAAGSVVTASYPFHGEAEKQQLTFNVGDLIKVKQKEDMWSWGVLERGGAEGWFPHNYVGSTFKPLPGIHEMAAKIKERRERLEGIEAAAAAAAAGGSDATGTPPEGADSATTTGATDADGVAKNGDDPKQSGERTDVGDSADGGKDGEKDGGDGAGKEGGTGVGENADGNAAGKPVDGADGTDGPAHAKAASSGAEGGDQKDGEAGKSTSPDALRNSSTDNAEAGKKPPLSASAAPSLPPFLKGGNTSEAVTVTPAVEVTQKAAVVSKESEAVEGTQIEGVGYAGTAPVPVDARCKCSIM